MTSRSESPDVLCNLNDFNSRRRLNFYIHPTEYFKNILRAGETEWFKAGFQFLSLRSNDIIIAFPPLITLMACPILDLAIQSII